MRKIFWIGMLALLIGCTEEYAPTASSDSSLHISIAMSSISTRATDAPADKYTLPFSEIRTFRIALYASLTGSPILEYTPSADELTEIRKTALNSSASVVIKNVPFNTKYAKVFINEQTGDPNINDLQPGSVALSDFPYEGTSDPITIPYGQEKKTVAHIAAAPTLTRFEIIPDDFYFVSPDMPTASSNDPNEGKYAFSKTEGAEGRAKIISFTEEEIVNAEKNALANYKKSYGDKATDLIYGYEVKVLSQYPKDNIRKGLTYAYVNYFKPRRSATELVKNENKGIEDMQNWRNSDYSTVNTKMYQIAMGSLSPDQVCAFNLFPQSASKPELAIVKQEMPHIILQLHTIKPIVTRATVDTGDPIWLTIRAFKDKNTGNRITSFKPGTCYQLRFSDIPMTMWTLQLKVDVRDKNGNTGQSDPITEDFSPTSNVPEPTDNGLTIGITVTPWVDWDIITDL